jgi:hypothetical protein
VHCVGNNPLFFLACLKCVWISHDTTIYLLSQCQLEHPECLGKPSAGKQYLHSYQHVRCEYSTWVVTLSVLEQGQLAHKVFTNTEECLLCIIWLQANLCWRINSPIKPTRTDCWTVRAPQEQPKAGTSWQASHSTVTISSELSRSLSLQHCVKYLITVKPA